MSFEMLNTKTNADLFFIAKIVRRWRLVLTLPVFCRPRFFYLQKFKTYCSAKLTEVFVNLPMRKVTRSRCPRERVSVLSGLNLEKM